MVHLPKLPWRLLEAWGVSLQVIKTALAAGLSWALASGLLGMAKPYFAPLAAILSVQATVAESLSHGMQRILGVLAGIVLALFLIRWMGLYAWSLALIVLIAMAGATRLHLGAKGIPQVAISALMVMAVGSDVPGYAWDRALDTALGAAVAVVVSALLWPPDLTPQAEESLRVLALALTDLLDGIRHDVLDGIDASEANQNLTKARAIAKNLNDAQGAISRAETSLRWNPWHRHTHGRLSKLSQALEVLDHTLIQVRGIARTLFVSIDRTPVEPLRGWPMPVGKRLGRVLAEMGGAMRSYADLVEHSDEAAALRLERRLLLAAAERRALWAEAVSLIAVDSDRFLDLASVLVDLEKMSQDLLVSSRLIVPVAQLSH